MKAKQLHALLTYHNDHNSPEPLQRHLAVGGAKAHNLLDDSNNLKQEFKNLLATVAMLKDSGGSPANITSIVLDGYEPKSDPETAAEIYKRLSQ